KSLENGDVFCDLAVMNSDGRQRRTLLRDEGPLESVLWSPSSQTVFFTGYLTQGHQGINRVDVRTGAARTVVAGGVSTPVSYLVVGPKHERIGFVRSRSVVIAKLDGRPLRKWTLTGGAAGDDAALWIG